jgi:hypothetical protein
MIATALIGYDDYGGCCWEDHEEEMIVINYFVYSHVQLRWISTPTLFLLLSASSSNDDL